MNAFHPEQCDLCVTMRYDTYCDKCSRHLCNPCNHGHACRDDAGLVAKWEKQKYKFPERTDPIITKYTCLDHKCEYNRFCGTCGVLLCQICCTNNHKDHLIEPISTASEKCAIIVQDLLTDLRDDLETAEKLITDLQEIISETEKRKQIQDVKDLVQTLESTLITAVEEKHEEENAIVSEYIKELQKCIKAWDKNQDKLDPVAKEVNSTPFLVGFSEYINNHENIDFPEAIDTNFLKHQRLLYYEDQIEKEISDVIEFVSSVTGIYAVTGIAGRVASPGTASASANISVSTISKIQKLFTKHPTREEHRINEKYVKQLQKEVEVKTKDIRDLQDKLSEMTEVCQHLNEYAKNVVKSESLITEQKFFAKKDGFSQKIGEIAKVITDLKSQLVNTDMNAKSVTFLYNRTLEEKEEIRQRFIEVAGRALSSGGSSRVDKADVDELKLPKHIIENFNDLYREEWRQTVDQLSIAGKWQAHVVIQHLFMIVQTCFISCRQISAQQTKELLSALLFDEEDLKQHKGEMKNAIDFKKRTAALCAASLQKKIIQKPEFQACLLKWDKKDYDLLSEIMNSPFFSRCVYLSWLMVVQSPPMYMDEGPARRSYINREIYHEFTKKGSIIDYCVWPALFVEKDGPLASKGVAQVY